MDKILKGILEEVAKEHNLEVEEVEKILKTPYKQMRDTINDLELKGKGSDEIEDLKTNFNMPALFKLFINKRKLDMFKRKENE